MPLRAPRLCRCGAKVEAGDRCACEARADAERKARFDKRRPNSTQRGYGRAWEKAKAEHLEAHRYCRMCGAAGTTVDHKTPHKGDAGLFWDRTNWQTLCTSCHSGAKQREERAMQKGKRTW